jgi:hypothetical protein
MNRFTRRDGDLMMAGILLWNAVWAATGGKWFNVVLSCFACALYLWALPDGWNLHKASLRAYRWLQGWLPVTVWKVDSPYGCGPWLMSPKEAAEFIRSETENAAGTIDDENTDTITIPEELISHLENGQVSAIEWKDWTIKRITIRRHQLSDEWGGW